MENGNRNEALAISEERFRQVADCVGVWIWEVDAAGCYRFCSDAVRTMMGYSVDEIVGKKRFYDLFPLKRRHELTEEMSSLFAQGNPFKYFCCPLVHSDGRTIIAEIFGLPMRDAGGTLIGYRGSSIDVTERKTAEETLQRTQFAVDRARDAIFLVRQDAGLAYVNEAACRSLGYAKEELLSLEVFDFNPAFPRDKWEELWYSQSTVESHFFETFHKHKDGHSFPVEISANPIVFGGKEYRVTYVRDISDRRREQEEKARLEAQLLHAQKMEAVGTLAGGLAHDFNNLLTVALGHTSLMLNEVDRHHPFYRRLRGIEAQIQSATDLTRQLLGFARKGKYQVVPTDLNELVVQSAEMFGRTKRELTIVRRLQGDLSPVAIDKNQIEQVLLNLLVNAWHAMPDGGTLVLKTENVSLEESQCRNHGMPAGAYVQLSVTDAGIGMDEETSSRVFEPFFTTKERGKGTGLGLAASYGIIKNHGGTINVASRKGEGTTFTVCLPASKQSPVSSAERPEDSLSRGSETILLIDDEEGITAISAEILNTLGYSVLTAQSGKEALEIFSANREKIDLVILDMIMPDMNGSEVFDRLKQLAPGIKVVLSSGYSLSEQAAAILERGCAGFMRKPYGMPELSKVVGEALQGKRVHSASRGE